MYKEDLSQKTDEELLALSLKNPDVFSLIVTRYEEKLLRKAKQLLGSEEEAEDVLQEVFVKIYLNAGRFRKVAGATFSSWAYKILFNTSFTYLKKRKREMSQTTEFDPEIYETLPDKSMDRDFERKLLVDEAMSVISKLPNAVADVLTKYFVKGKSEQQIADEEGMSIGAVRTRIHRAKKEFEKVKLNNNL